MKLTLRPLTPERWADLEAYPVDQRGDTADDALWFGTKSMYDAEGFVEVARRKPKRPVVRLSIA